LERYVQRALSRRKRAIHNFVAASVLAAARPAGAKPNEKGG